MTAKKAKKVTKKPPKPTKNAAVDAALSMAACMPWDMVTMADIAGEAGLTLADLSDVFDDKMDILVAYGRRIDRTVMESFTHTDLGAHEKDRLFEILMERFDVIHQNRAALLSILTSFMPDPKQAVISLPHLARSMHWMLEAAGMPSNGVKGALRLASLTGAYLMTLKVWMKDESQDLSLTMAALDKNLDRMFQFTRLLSM